jgi:NAD-dependent SIR2 family protein deacetylase
MEQESCFDACLKSPIAIFLGAGASVFLGFPLMSELTEKVQEGHGHRDLTDIMSHLAPKNDIESVLGYVYQILDCAERIKKNPSFRQALLSGAREVNPDAVTDTYTKLTENIKSLIFNIIRSIKVNIEEAVKLYNWLFMRIESHLLGKEEANIIPVITTNYDRVVESIENKGDYIREVVDGWSRDKNDRRVTTFYGHDNLECPIDGRSIALFKLHGSLNWYYSKDDHSKLRYFDSPLKSVPSEFAPLLVPPLPGKIGEYERHEIYNDMQRKVEKILSRIDLLLVIGYSFRDQYINSIVSRSLALNDKAKVLIIDPSEKSLRANIADAFGAQLDERLYISEYGFGTNKGWDEDLKEHLSGVRQVIQRRKLDI